jgi:TRAP-type C4-dicarboxylate transport system substrate-binding protein
MRLRCALALLVGALTTQSAGAAGETVWTMATLGPEGSPQSLVADRMFDEMEQASGGKLKIRRRWGGMLGDETTTLELCRKGQIVQVWAGSLGALAEIEPSIAVLETPYLFDSVADFNRRVPLDAFDTGPVAERLRDRGLVLAATSFIGWRAMSSRDRPIRRPADVRGLTVRSQPTPLHKAMWELLGARPSAIELPGVQSAFRLKQVDGSDLPLVYIFATSVAGQIRYYTHTNHMIQLAGLVINRSAFVSLSPRLQRDLLAVRAAMRKRMTTVSGQLDAELADALRAEKVTVIDLTPDERAAWRATLAPLSRRALELAGAPGQALWRMIKK